MPTTEAKLLHIAVGVLRDARGFFLLCQRPPGKHLEGLWEFPGGKVEQGEAVDAALARELHEEVGVQVLTAQPWLGISHRYRQASVFLDVWRVSEWRGDVRGCEGQQVRWVSAEQMLHLPLPEADAPIVVGCQRL